MFEDWIGDYKDIPENLGQNDKRVRKDARHREPKRYSNLKEYIA